MTEAQFVELASACDSLLRRPEANADWLAHPALHVLSEHPVHLAQYADLFDELGWTGAVAPRIGPERSRPYRVSSFAARQVRALMKAGVPAEHPEERGRPGSLLLVSWLVNAAHASSDDDFYFGDLQRRLAARGVSSLLVLRNQSGVETAELARSVRRPYPGARVLLPHLGSWRCERRAGAAQIRIRRSLASVGRSGRLSPLASRVARFAAARLPSSAVSDNLVFAGQLTEITRRLRPAALLTLYEGHAWERCAWAAARSVDRGIVCAGYQHTILRRRAHAVERRIGNTRTWDPDIVLSVGDIPADRLRQAESLQPTPVVVLGSHRRPPQAANAPRTLPGAVLVIPEGLERECVHLFGFALESARLAPTLKFIFRTHPVLPFDRLAGRLPAGGALPGNVEISRAPSIEDDFARSAICLYRGSSAAVYGVLAGLQPFYAALPGEMTLDPMFDLAGWRVIVDSPRAFVAAVKRAEEDDVRRQGDWAAAAEYCGRYAVAITDERVDDALAAINALRR